MLSYFLRRAAPGPDANAPVRPAPEQVIAAFVQTLARLDPCGSAPAPRRRPRALARKG